MTDARKPALATAKAAAGPLPPCPDHLPAAARAEWDRLVATLPAGMLVGMDAGLLGAYCQAVALHAEAVQQIAEFGAVLAGQDGLPVASPWIKIQDTQAGLLARLGRELGISPAARGAKGGARMPWSKR